MFIWAIFDRNLASLNLHRLLASLAIGKHKAIKFHFYADNTQVYVHLSKKNSSAAFEQLNRYLDDVKE